MQNETLNRAEAIEEIYLILAEFYKFPTEEFYQEIVAGGIDKRLQELWRLAGYRPYQVELSNYVNQFSEWKQSYMQCFMGITKPYAPPVESVYKVWTTDPSAELSIASSKGYFMGDAALHIRYLFEQFQITIPEEYKNMPDHLTLLLEFLSFLLREDQKEFAKQFLTDHFDWLDDFMLELKQLNNSSLFVEVTALVKLAVEDELKKLETSLK